MPTLTFKSISCSVVHTQSWLQKCWTLSTFSCHSAPNSQDPDDEMELSWSVFVIFVLSWRKVKGIT